MILSLVMPVYNEEAIIEKSLKEIINGVKKITTDFEIIIVENGSTDNTLKILKNLQKSLTVIPLPTPNLGLALKTGSLKAQGDCISYIYPDSYNFTFIKKSLNLLKKYDLVLGSKSKNTAQDKRSLKRKIVTKLYNSFLKMFLNTKYPNSRGLKSFKKSSFKNIIKASITQGAMFDTEITIRAEKSGLKIVEISSPLEEKRPSRLSLFSWATQTLPYLKTIKSCSTLHVG